MFSIAIVGSVGAQGTTPGDSETEYIVRPNDTLFGIAIRYRTTVSALAARNNIANINLIFIGQRLIIPASGTTPPPTTAPTATRTATTPPGTTVPTQTRTPNPTATTPGDAVTYIVRPGDTLGAIAQRFGTTVTAIAQLNGIVNPNLIYVGQRLRISGTPPSPTPTRTPVGPTPVPQGFELGGHVLSFAYPNEMRSAGMTWVKSQIRWSRGQPASIAQGAVDTARNNGFKILLGIVGTPSEMGADLNTYYQEYATFVGSVAAAHHPDAIEVWNEPNIDREWAAGRITPNGYAQMLRLAYQAIKATSPQTMVISGAPAPTGYFGGNCSGTGCDDAPFMRALAQAGGGQYADCIGIHYNEGILSPDATSGDPRGNPNHYTRYYRSMVNTYQGIFPSKPLCFTELGYLSPEGLGPLPPNFAWASNTSIQEQAAWLGRATTLSRQNSRIRLMIVWNVDATHYSSDDPQAGYAIVRSGQCVACDALGDAMGIP